MSKDIFAAIKNMKFVPRDVLIPNGYNPNKVSRKNLDLLKESILANGFDFPIVVRPDMTIIDGFHRWLISGEEPILSLTGGKVPVVIVEHSDHAEDMYATITFNRARGEHLLGPMKEIVKELIEQGKTTAEIAKSLGMSAEEVFRLSDFSRAEFLTLMVKSDTYGEAWVSRNTSGR